MRQRSRRHALHCEVCPLWLEIARRIQRLRVELVVCFFLQTRRTI